MLLASMIIVCNPQYPLITYTYGGTSCSVSSLEAGPTCTQKFFLPRCVRPASTFCYASKILLV